MEDNDIVEMSIKELIDAFAEALKCVSRKEPAFKVGDRVTLSGVVSGITNGHVHVLMDGMSAERRSQTWPAPALNRETV